MPRSKGSKMRLSKIDAKTEPCHRCQIIRSYVLVAFTILIIAFIGKDQFGIVKFVTPLGIAIGLMTVGLIVFAVKLISWKVFNKII